MPVVRGHGSTTSSAAENGSTQTHGASSSISGPSTTVRVHNMAYGVSYIPSGQSSPSSRLYAFMASNSGGYLRHQQGPIVHPQRIPRYLTGETPQRTRPDRFPLTRPQPVPQRSPAESACYQRRFQFQPAPPPIDPPTRRTAGIEMLLYSGRVPRGLSTHRPPIWVTSRMDTPLPSPVRGPSPVPVDSPEPAPSPPPPSPPPPVKQGEPEGAAGISASALQVEDLPFIDDETADDQPVSSSSPSPSPSPEPESATSPVAGLAPLAEPESDSEPEPEPAPATPTPTPAPAPPAPAPPSTSGHRRTRSISGMTDFVRSWTQPGGATGPAPRPRSLAVADMLEADVQRRAEHSPSSPSPSTSGTALSSRAQGMRDYLPVPDTGPDTSPPDSDGSDEEEETSIVRATLVQVAPDEPEEEPAASVQDFRAAVNAQGRTQKTALEKARQNKGWRHFDRQDRRGERRRTPPPQSQSTGRGTAQFRPLSSAWEASDEDDS